MARFGKREFEKLARKLEPKVAKAFLDAVANLKSSVSIKELVEAIDANDFEKVVALLQLQAKHLSGLYIELRNAFEAGAVGEISSVPARNPASKIAMSFSFDATNPRAVEWLRDYSSTLVREITGGTRTAIRDVLASGMQQGNNPRQTALDLVGRISKATGKRQGGVVGLTDYQAGLVQSFRESLIEKGLSQSQIDAKVIRYEAKKLRQRGQAIARTETLKSINAGKFEGAKQVIEQSEDLQVDDAIKVWDATGDQRTRPDHLTMEGQTKPLTEAFTAPDGSRLMHPCDSTLGASARQVIQCRCWMDIRYDWIGAYKRKRQAA